MPRGGDANDPPEELLSASEIVTNQHCRGYLKKPLQVRPVIDGKGQSASKC